MAAGLAYATWAVSLPPFSGAATAAVVAGGAAAVIWGGLGPSRTSADRAGSGWVARRWPWAVLGVSTAAWQMAAYLQHPRTDHPTLSSLTNAVLDSHPARAVAFTAWLAVASWLVRR